MSVTRSARPFFLSSMVAACLSLALAVPVQAQELGGQAFRTSLGGHLLIPGGDLGVMSPHLLSPEDRRPSGRAVLEIQANPNFGFHLGAMRMAPNVMWADSTAPAMSGYEEPRYQLGLTAGLVGIRLNFTTGRFRLGAFGDGGAGQAYGRLDRGGNFLADGRYQPALVDTTLLMAGGGGGLVLDAIVGPGLTISAIGGFWHFMSLARTEEGEPFMAPLSGAWAGVGAKLAFKDATYYWRHSGNDTEPPVLSVAEPQPDQNGVVDVGEDFTTLLIRAADLSDVDSIFVNNRKLQLVRDPRASGQERAVRTSVDLTLHPGPNQVSYTAFDGAGNRLTGTWEVLGIPLDKEGPRIAIIQPIDDLTISSENIMVEGIIVDQSPIEQITINGMTVRPREASDEDRQEVEAGAEDFVVRFSSTTNVPTADFDIMVAAVDSASNQRLETVNVKRADLAVAAAPQQQQPQPQQPAPAQRNRPEIEIYTPAEWSGGGTRGFAAQPKASIRIEGVARYAEGVREVYANNKRLSLQRDGNNPSRVEFSGFVEPPAPGSEGDVEILVRGNDGEQAIQTYTTRTAAQAQRGAAQFEEVANAQNRQRWAVIIGVSDYQDETIGDLNYADDDARAVYEFLRSPAAGMGGIPEENIAFLVDEEATSRNVRSALTTFLRQSTPSDVIFLYIAAHGAPDPYRPDDLYILTHDTEIADIAATAVSMADVNRAMQDAYAYNKVVMTDACHSGGVGAGTRALNNNQINSAFLDYMNSSAGGFVTFTASESNQLSQEGEQYGGGHGVFTYHLLEGLKGAADEDGDHVITLGEVMEYTRDRVRRVTRNAQVPTISQTSYDRFWPMAAVLNPEAGSSGQQ